MKALALAPMKALALAPAMPLNDEMTGDFLSLWEDVPVFMEACGSSIKVLLSRASRSLDLDLGGFTKSQSLEARILRRDMPTALVVGSIVVVDGVEYRVEDIAKRPGLPIVSLTLTQP